MIREAHHQGQGARDEGLVNSKTLSPKPYPLNPKVNEGSV